MRPNRPEGALGPYLRAIRAHRIIVPVITLVAVLAAVGWLVHRSPTYESKAEVLVNPLPADDQTFFGIQVLRDTPGDPTRVVQTATTLFDSPLAAREAAQKLGPKWTLDEVQNAVKVEPEGQSNIIDVTAKVKNHPKEAARVANAFAQAALDVRASALREEVQSTLAGLRARLRALPAGPQNQVAAADLAQQINQLESVASGRDPTLSLLQGARPPSSPTGTPGWLVIVLAILAGFMLATGTALLIELLDRRVRDQDEMLELFPLPILARVPQLPRRLRKNDVVSPVSMPPAVREAFRTLMVQIEQRSGSHRTIMVTSASSRDGKTTSAINLAFTLVGAGHKVIVMDLDLRKPDVGRTLGVDAEHGLVSLLASDLNLSDLLVPAPQLPPLQVAPAGNEGDVVLLEAITRRLPDILKQAEGLADYIILDTAPLGEVSDALRMTDLVDDIIVVTRPGHTNRANFELMRDLLDQTGRQPLGYLVVGVTTGVQSSYYAYGAPTRREAAGRSRFARSSAR